MSLHPPSPSKPNSNSSNALSLMTPTASSASVDTIILKHIPADPVSLDPSYSAPSKPTSLEIVADDTINISRNSPSWRAARESVLRQMVTAQDIPTPAITAKVNAKTGGRRGRGGRRSTVKVEKQEQPSIITNGTDLNISGGSAAERGKGKGRGKGGGRPRVRPIGGPGRGTKRKRGHNDDEDEASKDDTDASETFTPLPTQSRSGRRIFKASTFTPVIIDLEGPAEDKALTRGGNLTSTESRRKGNKRRRKPGDASVCKNCGRGHSPVGNMIVFCDGCNTPWHQYCHDQPIGVDVVRIEEKEWFCADCEVLREERSHVEGNVSAEDMTIMEVLSCHFPSVTRCRICSLRLSSDLSFNHNRNVAIYKPSRLHISFLFSFTPPLFTQTSRFSHAHLQSRHPRHHQTMLRLLMHVRPPTRSTQKTTLMTSIRKVILFHTPKPATASHFLPKLMI